MAKMTVSGLDEFEAMLYELAPRGGIGAAKMAVYDGAAIIADQIRDNLTALPAVTEGEALAAYNKGKHVGISIKQKKALLDSLGIADIEVAVNDINTHIGFDGYNDIQTERWPSGQPNTMIARSIESGTSFMQKQPFMRTAVNSKKGAAQAKMAETFEKRIKEITGG